MHSGEIFRKGHEKIFLQLGCVLLADDSPADIPLCLLTAPEPPPPISRLVQSDMRMALQCALRNSLSRVFCKMPFSTLAVGKILYSIRL